MERHELTDEQWALITDMFPKIGLKPGNVHHGDTEARRTTTEGTCHGRPLRLLSVSSVVYVVVAGPAGAYSPHRAGGEVRGPGRYDRLRDAAAPQR